MAWLDDFSVRIRQEADKAFSDINDYVKNRAIEPVVKIGQEQLGNLSQAQIDAGKAGGPKPAAASAIVAQGADFLQANLPYLLIGTIAYFIFSSSKKRG